MNNDKKEMESIFEGFDEVKFDSNDRKKVFNTLKTKGIKISFYPSQANTDKLFIRLGSNCFVF